MSFKVIRDTHIDCQNGEELHLQYGQLGNSGYFYRFHRKELKEKKSANGEKLTKKTFLTRGQAVIESMADVHKLISQAIKEGWNIV